MGTDPKVTTNSNRKIGDMENLENWGQALWGGIRLFAKHYFHEHLLDCCIGVDNESFLVNYRLNIECITFYYIENRHIT